MISAAMPDVDVIAFQLGISYTHWLGHRGLTHSLFFAAIWGLLITWIFFKKEIEVSGQFLRIAFLLSIVTASHGVIDAMTNGGRGIGFLIPFTDERFFLPFRPIQVSPLGIENFFSKWGLEVIKSEFIWLVLPCIVIWALIQPWNKR
jgi:inner membrane protein